MIPPEIIEQVRKADLVSIIGRHVELKRKGRDYWGCCPFHSEKTPSFHITPAENVYYCMGCAKGGDAIKWMMDFHSLSFTDAVRALAADMMLHFSEVKETLAPKRFKKLAMTEEKKQDEKVAFVDRGRACSALQREVCDNLNLKKWLHLKRIIPNVVQGLARHGMIGWWGGKLTYFYPYDAIKIRGSLDSSRESRWIKGSAEECWIAESIGMDKRGLFMFEGESDLMRSSPLVPPFHYEISMPSASWTPTPEQCYRIGAFREVTLCFDGDRAGREATKRIASLLKKHANGCKVYDLQMPDGMDCCKLTDEELKKLIDSKVELK